MKSSYEKDLKSANTRSKLYICILILNEPAGSQEVHIYIYIYIYICMYVYFMISIIVLLPLRGCPLRCYFSLNIIVNNSQDK